MVNSLRSKGSAMIELVTTVPFLAALLIVIMQFAYLFTQLIYDTAKANTEASKKALEWEESHKTNGFERPCLEKMETKIVSAGGEELTIGLGDWKQKFKLPQEVRIASTRICIY